MRWYTNTITDSSMSYSSNKEKTIPELQSIHYQGFSDSAELSDIKSDITQIPQIARPSVLTFMKFLWELIKPKEVLSLKPCEIKKISNNLLVEKTSDGRIILYEIIE